ncbi:Holliday junction resolvase RuvX [Azotosporobacter soli]|uniref:Holliday junction resolvase RuvX n=1 Tax=Azotosporobacter soli TaxID=3055040 RepID=UPI0031FF19A9
MIGLDVGDKTIGIAVSDGLGITAQGVEVIRRTSLAKDLDRLRILIEQYDAKELVIGLPKNMDGSIGASGEKVQALGDVLKETFPLVKLTFWDERLTTVAASRMLIEADVRRDKRRQVIDKLAAVLILQGYMDGCRRSY